MGQANGSKSVSRFRRRVSYWPAALLILAVGMCGRARTSQREPAPARQPVSRPALAHAVPSDTSAHEEAAFPEHERTPAADKPHVTPANHARRDDSRQLHLHVVGVHDGDTITGLDDTKTQHKIRLDAIDAPELGQPYGQAAKKTLSEKVFGKNVVVTVKTTDRYGRTVGHVLIDGRDVNLEMLEEGMAWHYVKYDHNKRLQEAEQSARAAKKGLWQDPSAEPPWDYRTEHRHGKHGAETK